MRTALHRFFAGLLDRLHLDEAFELCGSGWAERSLPELPSSRATEHLLDRGERVFGLEYVDCR